MAKYVYCPYWHRWSRVLSSVDGISVELNLTPIPHSDRTWAEDVAPGKIRRHCTVQSPSDFHNELPEEIVEALLDNLGVLRANWLLEYDFLPEIDWDLYDKCSNGGCRWDLCRKR